MKIFLSSLENGAQCKKKEGEERAKPLAHYFAEQNVEFKWNLISYFYVQNQFDLACFIRDRSEELLVDSGAHSFQKGKRVDWVKYTKEYADFIRRFDNPKVVGYFEMDVDNIIGYENVLQLREILESVSDKIIPVWHKNRGIEEFKRMCRQYSGKIVAITGFKNEDIKDDQYLMFLKYAKKHNCKVHCLGMTRKKILDQVPFDYVDSSSWKQMALYGRVGKKKASREFSKQSREVVMKLNYEAGVEMQKHYHKKWRGVCKD